MKLLTSIVGGVLIICQLLQGFNSEPVQRKDADVMLIGGSGDHEGTVLVYHNRRWGSVCDFEWDLLDAAVVCKQLGYPGAKEAVPDSKFGRGRKRMWMSDMHCRGYEENLNKCMYPGWGRIVAQCRGSSRSAGVICQTEVDTTPPPTPPSEIRTDPPMNLEDMLQADDPNVILHPKLDIRMAGGRYNWEGRLEIREGPSGEWGTICGDNWTLRETMVACRQMRGDHGKQALQVNYFGGEGMHKIFSRIKCTGREANLDECEKIRSEDGAECSKTIMVAGSVCSSDDWNNQHCGFSISTNWEFDQMGWSPLYRVFSRNVLRGTPFYALGASLQYDVERDVAQSVSCLSVKWSVIGSIILSERSGRLGYFLFQPVVHNWFMKIHELPDLTPDLEVLENSLLLHDRHLYYLTCSMEENCLSSSAYVLRNNSKSWRSATRRLLKFSSVIHNVGTADFRPFRSKTQWEWHSCHQHYHSMEVFAAYDLINTDGKTLVEGSKASFCLEDSTCYHGTPPRYNCLGFRDQGLSVNCSDDYLNDIDCQWLDITDIKPGDYTFKLAVNPTLLVSELNFDNNVAVCDLWYSGYSARISNCRHESLLKDRIEDIDADENHALPLQDP